jgi:hypothetical protein
MSSKCFVSDTIDTVCFASMIVSKVVDIIALTKEPHRLNKAMGDHDSTTV